MPLLYRLLDSDNENVQGGALEVLTEIASKRMDAEAKLRLLQQLGLVARAASWQAGLPGSPEDSVQLKAVRLLATLCTGERCLTLGFNCLALWRVLVRRLFP